MWGTREKIMTETGKPSLEADILLPAPTHSGLELRHSDFDTLCEGLDYVAKGKSGLNYFDGKARLKSVLTYSDLRERAIDLAYRLVDFAPKNSRIGLAAVSTPEFAVLFFACQYAGLVPAPLPLNDQAIPVLTFDDVVELPKGKNLREFDKDDLCYIQYSSGSSSSPKGIIGTQKSVTANCLAITKHGLKINKDDRCTSWLPLYHDMGLIGFLIAPLMSQMTIDYMDPQDFTRRPISWLQLINDHKGTLSYSPTFGYELCVRRWREDRTLDLSSWRAAGIGGDMVRPEPLTEFQDLFADMKFNPGAFTPSYGLAETTLAASFAPLGQGLKKHTIDMDRYERTSEAVTASDLTPSAAQRTFVACGTVLPDHQIEIRDFQNNVLSGSQVGRICLKGPSVSPGYFRNSQATEAAFTADGWLDTGDLGYWLDDQIVVTGRSKDLILWHGRNIWPQDIEWAAQAAAPHRCGRACAFSIGGAGDDKQIMLLLECRTRNPELLDEIFKAVTAAIRLEVGVPVRLQLVPKSTMIVTSSGKLSRSRVKEKFLSGGIIDLQNPDTISLVKSGA